MHFAPIAPLGDVEETRFAREHTTTATRCPGRRRDRVATGAGGEGKGEKSEKSTGAVVRIEPV